MAEEAPAVRFKGTIVLTILLVLLGLYLFYIEIPGAKKKEEAESKAKRLFSFSESAVTGLTIQSPEGVIELEHSADPDQPWKISRPVATAANDAAASGLASQLERLESTRVVEESPADLKAYGLDPPAYSIIIHLNQTDVEPLQIGGENPAGTEVYVRKGEAGPVYLTAGSVKQFLKKDLKEWRRRELFRFETADVKRIRIEGPRRELELVREGEGWLIKKPLLGAAEGAGPLRGDPSAISNLLGSALNLRGDDFIDAQKEEKKKELGPPVLKLNLEVGAVEREASFYKLKQDGTLDVRNPDAVYAVTTPSAPIYKISAQSFQSIDQPVNALRDKKALSLNDVESVEEIVIKRPERTVVLRKKEGAWTIGSPSPQKMDDPGKVSLLLFDLRDLQVEEFPDPSKAARTGLGNPSVSIQLKGKEGTLLEEIAFGRAEGDRVYARTLRQSTPFFLKKEDADRVTNENDFIASTPAPSNPAPKSK